MQIDTGMCVVPAEKQNSEKEEEDDGSTAVEGGYRKSEGEE